MLAAVKVVVVVVVKQVGAEVVTTALELEVVAEVEEALVHRVL